MIRKEIKGRTRGKREDNNGIERRKRKEDKKGQRTEVGKGV
jgi:hypothetical protein